MNPVKQMRRFISCVRTGRGISSAVLLPILCLLLGNSIPSIPPGATEDERILRTVADAILRNATFDFVDRKSDIRVKSPGNSPIEAHLQISSPYTDWRYWNGVLNLALLRFGSVIHEPAYVDFPLKNISFSFDNCRYFEERYRGEDKWTYPFAQLFIMEELDDCGAMGAGVIEVYARDLQDRYRTYIDKVARHVSEVQQRLDSGVLVRSFPRRWTLWADDLYMGVSFLARMGELSNDVRYYDDAVQQVIEFHRYLFDEGKGLMHHCWYSDEQRPGSAFWGRANGWALMAQVDLLDRLPRDHPQRSRLLELLRRHILGIAQYQSREGLWHQLLDKSDSYLETSCTAMFTYTVAHAVSEGYIESRYDSIALRGWEGVLFRIRSDGEIEGVSAGTGVSDDLDYYYRRPTPLNDIHGIGPVLLAGAEVIHLSRRPR